MPRKQSLDVRVYCLKCKDYTQSIEPIIIKKDVGSRFHINAMCSICNKFKSKFLNLEQVKLLPKEVRESENGSTFNNNVIIDGKALPLLALIPLVIAGISALTSVAGTTASVVLTNKEANETERHHKKLEDVVARGNGISNEEIKIDEQKVLSDTALPVKKNISDDELIKQSMKFLRGKGYIIYICK